DELIVVAFEDAFLGELHALPTAGGEARRVAHRLVLPQRPALVEGCVFFNQGAEQAGETVSFTRVHAAR
ncbi:MAG: hypothetical protein KC583_00870, partial [Myxococcales bacterium]|nr:hypothetical protein [Myxococcales bacterium]